MHNRPLDNKTSPPLNDKLDKKEYADSVAVAAPAPLSATEHPLLLTDLPTECLQLVVSHFERDLSGLHSLLRTNRQLFRLAVPLLYRSPFQLVRDYDGDKLPWDKFKRQVKLLWVLLCSVIHHRWVNEELPPFSPDFPTLYAPDHGSNSSSTTQNASGGNRRKELTTDYLQFYTHQDHASISDAFPSLFPSLVCFQMEQWSSSDDMHRIRACIEKAFLMHHPERIQSLSIPVTRIGSIFLEAVGQLRRLRRVEFYDIKFEFDSKDAIEFLRRHQHAGKDGTANNDGKDTMTPSSEMLPSTTTELTEIKIGGPGDRGVIGKMDLYKILQAMHRPVVIDLTGWRGAVMDIAQIPVQSLRTLLLRLDLPLPADSPVQTVLDSARHLRHLQLCIAPNQGDLFRWAVEKRRASLEADRQKKDVLLSNAKEPKRRRPSLLVQDSPRVQRIGSIGSLDFVPEECQFAPSAGLESLSIAGETQAVVWALMGATEAYPKTLQTLKASSWKRSVNLDLEEDNYHHQENAHTVAPGPAHLGLDPYPYGQVAPPELSIPPLLPQMPQQVTPANGNQNDDSHVRRDIPRLCLTPNMTRLVHLELKGEVAALAFDFRSLSHCPQLLTLILNTHPCGIEPDLSSLSRILDHAPRSLQQLELMGPWLVTDYEMKCMAHSTEGFPDLRRLRMVHCKTSAPVVNRIQVSEMISSWLDLWLTTRGLFRAIEKLTQLRELELGLDMDQQQRSRRQSQGSTTRLQFNQQTLSEGILPRKKATENKDKEARRADDDDEDENDLGAKVGEDEDLEWSVLPRLLKDLSRHRVIPLHFDIQHWSL